MKVDYNTQMDVLSPWPFEHTKIKHITFAISECSTKVPSFGSIDVTVPRWEEPS